MRSNTRKLTVEAEKVVQVVNKYGGASFEQLKEIISNPLTDVSKVAHFLALQQYLDIVNEKYVSTRKHTTINSSIIDCLWVVIDSLKYEDVFDYETFSQVQTYIGGNSKITATFIKDSSYIINVAHITKNNIIDAVFLQNRFYELNNVVPGKEKDKKIAHFFVTRNKEVVEEIKELGLKIPYVIVLLTYKNTDRPDICYIKE